jgi:hypothetical protein
MNSDYWWNQSAHPLHSPQAKSLLGSGWRSLNRQLNWDFFWHLTQHDSTEMTRKTADLMSEIAITLGRREYAWWANVLSLFSESTRYKLDEFWNYITPEPPTPDQRYRDVLATETPLKHSVHRNTIAIDNLLKRLQEVTILKVLSFLGQPDFIIQAYLDQYFYYPIDRFTNWDKLEVLGTVYAHWSAHEVWLQINPSDQRGKQWYSLLAQDLSPLINKATYNLAVMLSGYQSRVGQIQSQFSIRDFPTEIQNFTDAVQQAVLSQSQLAVLVQGEPGTGKTAWTQAIAKEVLAPLGYVIFILDHDAVENFIPPTYLERICLIINEADNLAKNRALQVAQHDNKTEHILSLLDGTLHQSIADASSIQNQQHLVVLMTCNTSKRLDPALLRKGRIDLICEFTYRFV